MAMLKNLALAVGILGAWLAGASAQAPIRLATMDFPPYSFSVGGRIEGAAVDQIRCLFGRAGLPIRLELLSWPEALERLRKGSIDGFFPATANAERDKYGVLSRTFIPQRWVFYMRAGQSFDAETARQSRSFRVGAVAGSTTLQYLEQHNWNITLRTPTVRELFDALLNDRIEAALVNQLVMDSVISAGGAGGRLRYVPFLERPMGIYISRQLLVQRPDLMPRLNDEVEMCE